MSMMTKVCGRPLGHPKSVGQNYSPPLTCHPPWLHAVPPKPGTHGPQVALYDRCLERWGSRHEFMAFIDTDEFLVLRDGTPDLPTLVSPEAGSQALLACCPAECLGNVGCSCQQCRRTSILPLLCSLCCAVEGLHGVWWPGGQLAGVW